MSEKNYEFIDIKRIEQNKKSKCKKSRCRIYEQTNIKSFRTGSRCLGW